MADFTLRVSRRFVIKGHGKSLIRYTAVGGVATAVHFAVLALCVEAWHWPAWWGSGVGAVVGAQVAFWGNRRLTFDHQGSWRHAWWRFMLTALGGAVLGMVIVAALTAVQCHYLIAQAVATTLVLVLGYVVNRMWSFASPR